MTREPKKGLTLPNGNRLGRGQLFLAKGNTMKPNLARDGAAKRLTTPAITHGMVRQSAPSHAYLHGQAVDDEVNDKNFVGKGNVETHPEMFSHPKSNRGDRLRGTHDRDAGNKLLHEAGRLGNPKS